MKKFIVLAATAALAVAVPMASFAEPHEGGEGQGKPMMGRHMAQGMLMHLDADKDGKVTKDEFMDDAAKRFTEIDSDSNKEISVEELEAFHKAQMEKQQQVRKEMEERRQKEFKEIDSNNDGSISKEEMEAFQESHKGMPPKGEGKPE